MNMAVRTQKIGECHLDLGRRGVIRDGKLNRLEPRDFEVLKTLVDNAPNFVSTRALLCSVWRNKIVGDNVLHQSIGRLRRVLGDDAKNPRYIETLTKLGYQFIAPVTPLDQNRDCTAELNPIAVMPFKDYSKEANDAYVVDGLCFEICHQLIQAGAQVVSLDQAARMQRSGLSDLEVGGRVGARTVLGGSLIVAGERLRVTASLGDVVSGRQLWSMKQDFVAGQLLDMHTELSESIVKNIYESLGGVRKSRAAPVLSLVDDQQPRPNLSY